MLKRGWKVQNDQDLVDIQDGFPIIAQAKMYTKGKHAYEVTGNIDYCANSNT